MYIRSLRFQLNKILRLPDLIWDRDTSAHIIGLIINLPSLLFAEELTDRINSLYLENFKAICKYWFGSEMVLERRHVIKSYLDFT